MLVLLMVNSAFADEAAIRAEMAKKFSYSKDHQRQQNALPGFV
jgi:hypothetical protein